MEPEAPQATATVKTVEHGEASAVVPTSWGSSLARHAFVFLLATAMCWGVYLIIQKVDDVATLREIARNGLLVLWSLVFGFVFGAGAADVIALLTAFWSTRKITVATAPAPATIQSTPSPTGEGSATKVSTPGQPAEELDDGELPPEDRIP